MQHAGLMSIVLQLLLTAKEQISDVLWAVWLEKVKTSLCGYRALIVIAVWAE